MTRAASSPLGQLDRFAPPPRSLALAFLGQVGVALRGPDGVVYIDPYLSDYGWPLPDGGVHRLPRAYPPVLEPQAAKDATAVLITHDHADHFDPETLAGMRLVHPALPVYGPYRCRDTHPDVALEDTIGAFEKARAESLIGAYGVSNFDAEQLKRAAAAGAPACVQNAYSLLDRGNEDGVLGVCAQSDVAYAAFGPLAGGWLMLRARPAPRTVAA